MRLLRFARNDTFPPCGGINLLACELPLSRERERAYTLTVYA